MIKATILERSIDDDLQPELILVMTYIKNSCPIRALKNLIPYKGHLHKWPNMKHLQILGSIIYILLHKKKRLMKSENWTSQVLKRPLIGYDGHTISKVYIKEQKKVI